MFRLVKKYDSDSDLSDSDFVDVTFIPPTTNQLIAWIPDIHWSYGTIATGLDVIVHEQ